MEHHQHGPNCGCKEYQAKATEEITDLLSLIDRDRLECLNELEKGSVQKVFRNQEHKLEKEEFIESDIDPEVIIVIPRFISNIKLKTICIAAVSRDDFPQKMKIFINQEQVDFNIVEDMNPIQEFELGPNLDTQIECSVKPSRFTNVNNLVLHLSAESFDRIQIAYIGLKGVDTKMKRQVVRAQYEAKPMLQDHDVKSQLTNNMHIG